MIFEKISNGVASSIEKLTKPQVEAIQLTRGSVKKFNQKKINGKNNHRFYAEK
jgi:hypothetical protein